MSLFEDQTGLIPVLYIIESLLVAENAIKGFITSEKHKFLIILFTFSAYTYKFYCSNAILVS